MNNCKWKYKDIDFSTNNVSLIEEGDYRVRIDDAIPTVAKNGTEGLAITLNVNGDTRKLKYYIWFNYNDENRTNRQLGAFFNSFDINPQEEPWCEPWIDKIGAVHVIHSDYKGRKIAKVAYCITRDRQSDLPEWKEASPTSNDNERSFDNIESPPSEYICQTTPEIDFTNFNF